MDFEDEAAGLLPDGSMDTYTGTHVNLTHIDPESILIEDIAHHLSLICRYNGACKFHYSVAQHSVLASSLIGRWGATRLNMLAALLHDASEAYLGDIIRPVKYQKGNENIAKTDAVLQKIINKKFGIEEADWNLVKFIDNIMAATEAKQIMTSGGMGWLNLPESADIQIVEMQPRVIEASFLTSFEFLRNRAD